MHQKMEEDEYCPNCETIQKTVLDKFEDSFPITLVENVGPDNLYTASYDGMYSYTTYRPDHAVAGLLQTLKEQCNFKIPGFDRETEK